MIFRVFILISSFFVINEALCEVCTNPKMECVEPGSTKYFDGVPVTLDCWKYKVSYECKVLEDEEGCTKLKERGCSPAAAICKLMWGDVCAVQEVTYDCPDQKCDEKETICSNPNAFCATGDCVNQERSKDTDMGKSLAALSAAAEAAKLIDKSNINDLKVFPGKARECSQNIASGITKDCCGISPSGFLEGALLKCEDDEVEVARAKAEGRAVYLGEYCYNEVLGVCMSHHKTFCLFGSKLARIVQTGARAQLGIPFGGPKTPNCRGLAPEEFEKVDFSKIDFSDFYNEIASHVPKQTLSEITKKTEKASAEAKKHAEKVKKMSRDTADSVEKIREKMQSKMRKAHNKSEQTNEELIKSRDKNEA